MIGSLAIELKNDVLRKSNDAVSIQEHQKSAINWLKRAHDMGNDGGVSYGYYLRGKPFSAFGLGWRSSYIETSGYIVDTFFDIAKRYHDDDCALRAEQIGRWLLTIQNSDGSFSNARYAISKGIVFDTGQVLFGLIRCYQETQDVQFLEAAQKASSWLAKKTDNDGAWRQNTHQDSLHTYNTRTAWAMLECCRILPDADVERAARKNLNWALSHQMRNGLFENCSFKTGLDPFTHTIAYAVRGLYEGGLILQDERFIAAAKKAAICMAEYVDESGFLPGRISATGQPHNGSACLTGNCQMAIIWYKIGKAFDDHSLIETANLALDFVLSTQNIHTKNENIRGAIKGSHPIWGKYTPMAYPNWATKFQIDALLLREEIS